MLKSNILKSALNISSHSSLNKTINFCIPQQIECQNNILLTFTLPSSKNGYDTFSNINLRLDDLILQHYYNNKKVTLQELNELFFSYLSIDKSGNTSIISTRLGKPSISLFDMIDYIKINHFVFDESNLFVLKHLNKYKHLSNHEIFLPNLFSKDNLKSKIIQISLNTRLQSIRSGSSVCDTKKKYLFGDGQSASKPNFLTTKLVHLKKNARNLTFAIKQ